MLAASLILLYGCGNSSQPAGNQPAGDRTAGEIGQEKTSYVSLPLTLPDYVTFDGAWSDGVDLYYSASLYDEAADALTSSFYVLRQGAAEPEERFALAENHLALHMTMDDTGHTYYVGYQNIPPAEDGSQPPVSYSLHKVDADGAPLFTVELAEYIKSPDVQVQYIAVDGEGRIVLTCPDQSILVLNPDGSLLFETKAGGMILDLCSSGGLVFLVYDELGQTVIQGIDMSAQKLAGKWEIDISGRLYMSGKPDGDLLLANDEGVFHYGTGTGALVKKFGWQSYDFHGLESGYLLPYGENGVLAVNRDWSFYPIKVDAVAFREAAEGEVLAQDKIVLTLSLTERPPNGIYDAITAFNEANPEYKIEVVPSDFEEEYTRIKTEITAGQGPDIVMMPAPYLEEISYGGAFVDLYPYLQAEYDAGTINPEDLYENVIAAFEQDGHLYGLPIQFWIETIAVKSSLTEERKNWNLEEFIEFTGNLPDGQGVFINESKSGVLKFLKRGYHGRLVNLSEPEAPLDRELLMQMLEFANQYEDDSSYHLDSNLAKRVYEDDLVLLQSLITDYGAFAYAAYTSLLGEPATLIGYPSGGNSGNLARSKNSIGINQNCQHKDVAWSFISSLLSEEFQANMTEALIYINFPIRKDALAIEFKEVIDERGYQEEIFGFYIDNEAGFSYDNWLWYLTEEDQQPILDMIDNIDTAWRPVFAIDAIIEEEAAYYFSGDKPLEEVVDVIEDRIKTYVYEKQ